MNHPTNKPRSIISFTGLASAIHSFFFALPFEKEENVFGNITAGPNTQGAKLAFKCLGVSDSCLYWPAGSPKLLFPWLWQASLIAQGSRAHVISGSLWGAEKGAGREGREQPAQSCWWARRLLISVCFSTADRSASPACPAARLAESEFKNQGEGEEGEKWTEQQPLLFSSLLWIFGYLAQIFITTGVIPCGSF